MLVRLGAEFGFRARRNGEREVPVDLAEGFVGGGAVADGTATLSPKVTAALIESYVDKKAAPRKAQALRRIRELSDREREVLQLLGSGGSNAELAGRLFVSEATVKTYVSRLLTKLDLVNRTQAAILAHEAGLLDG